jgi:hypothetical protein
VSIPARRSSASVARWVSAFAGPVERNAVLARRCWRRGVLAVLRRLRPKVPRLARPVPVRLPRPRPAAVPVPVRVGPGLRPESPHAP